MILYPDHSPLLIPIVHIQVDWPINTAFVLIRYMKSHRSSLMVLFVWFQIWLADQSIYLIITESQQMYQFNNQEYQYAIVWLIINNEIPP